MSTGQATLHPPRDTSWISLILIVIILLVGAAGVVGVFQVKRQRARAERRERARREAEELVRKAEALGLQIESQRQAAGQTTDYSLPAMGLMALASQATQSGDFPEAYRLATLAYRQDQAIPGSPEWGDLCRALADTQESRLALELLGIALSIRRNDKELQVLRSLALARILMEEDRKTDAITELETLDPSPERDELLEKAKKLPDNP